MNPLRYFWKGVVMENTITLDVADNGRIEIKTKLKEISEQLKAFDFYYKNSFYLCKIGVRFAYTKQPK